jgi:Zn finger protein HypA/HybF involved in hydrogenase expression
MKKRSDENIVGFQRLVCKNRECNYLLKTVYFHEGWDHRSCEENGVSLVNTNGSQYYVCPQCRAKNFVILQGEKICIEKIIHYEPDQDKN